MLKYLSVAGSSNSFLKLLQLNSLTIINGMNDKRVLEYSVSLIAESNMISFINRYIPI